jgi:hypothetical protein
MSVRSVGMAAFAAFIALGTMTFAVSPVFARDCGALAAGPAAPIFSVSPAVD